MIASSVDGDNFLIPVPKSMQRLYYSYLVAAKWYNEVQIESQLQFIYHVKKSKQLFKFSCNCKYSVSENMGIVHIARILKLTYVRTIEKQPCLNMTRQKTSKKIVFSAIYIYLLLPLYRILVHSD